ncbi:hypothetical protein M2273_005536 [Mucilaginibacter lappiensis]
MFFLHLAILQSRPLNRLARSIISKNIDTYLLEIWNEGVLIDVGEQLNKAIVIGGMNDEQYFFLIPPDYPDNKWQYWKFANWIPGEQRYENLENYFQSVLDFIKGLHNKS